MCQRSLADLPRGKQWYQHIPEGSVSNLGFSLGMKASHTQAHMPAPSWCCYEARLHLGSWGPPRAGWGLLAWAPWVLAPPPYLVPSAWPCGWIARGCEASVCPGHRPCSHFPGVLPCAFIPITIASYCQPPTHTASLWLASCSDRGLPASGRLGIHWWLCRGFTHLPELPTSFTLRPFVTADKGSGFMCFIF